MTGRLSLILGAKAGSVLPPPIDIEETYPVSSKLGQGGITFSGTITSQKNILGADTNHFETDGTVIKNSAAGVAAALGMGPYTLVLSTGEIMRITGIAGAGVRSAAEFATWAATDAPSITALKAAGTLWWREGVVDPGIAGNSGNPLRRGNYNDGAGEPAVKIRSIYELTDPARRVQFSSTVKWNFQGIEWWGITKEPTFAGALFEINGDNGGFPAGHIHIYGCDGVYPEMPWTTADDAFYAVNGNVAFSNAAFITGSGANVGRFRIGSCSTLYAKSFCRYLGTKDPSGIVLTNISCGRYYAIAVQFSVNDTAGDGGDGTVVPWEVYGITLFDPIAKVSDGPAPPNNPHPDGILATGRNTFTGKQTILIYDYLFYSVANVRGDVGPYWAARDMVTGTIGSGGVSAGGAFDADFRRWKCMSSKGGIMLDHQNASNCYFEDVIIAGRGVDSDPLGSIVCGGTGPGQSTYGTHVLTDCYSEGYSVGGTPTLTGNVTVSNNTLAAWQAYFPNINFAPADAADAYEQLTPA